MARTSKLRLTKEQKNQILAIVKADPSRTAAEIAVTLGLNGQQVCGVIATARNSGLLPDPKAAPYGTPCNDGGFTGGIPVHSCVPSPSTLAAANFPWRWVVERIIPHDGVLGEHFGRFTIEQLGRIYGEGTYKVTRFDPTRANKATEFRKKISPAYGPRRAPPMRPAWAGPAPEVPRREYGNPLYAQMAMLEENARLKARIEELGRQIAAKDAQIQVLIEVLGKSLSGRKRR